MNGNFYNNISDYWVVLESQTEPGENKIVITKEVNNNNLKYIKFTSVLQSFVKYRNRNRRHWEVPFVKQGLQDPDGPAELLREGGVPGEYGHPIPDSGKATIERITTIDPKNVSHKITQFTWTDDDKFLYGSLETKDDGESGVGRKLRNDILQNYPISFSCRSVIPQRLNNDGTIDQVGVGRIITYDRVYLPSHSEAYIDKSFPIENIIEDIKDVRVLESLIPTMYNKSEKSKRILDKYNPVMESMTIDKNGFLTTKIEDGYTIIPLEKNIRKEISYYMRNL